MAYAAISKPSLYQNTVLYTGNGTTQALTGVGFQPDFTWIKNRDATDSHMCCDAVRGVTKIIFSNLNNIEDTDVNSITAFGVDGFSVGSSGNVNTNTEDFVAWNWKANGAGSLNEVGTIDSTVSVNTTSGFSIVKYTGTGAAATIGHGLGAVPKAVIVKKLSQSDDWFSYHEPLGNLGRLQLSTNGAAADNSGYWDSTTPTSTVFTVLANGANNASGETHVAYCFAEVKGFSKFSSYSGNGNADGSFVYTGFKPSFIITKRVTGSENWMMFDNKRLGYNVDNNFLFPNLNNAEVDSDQIDILSNGFKMRTTNDAINNDGGECIYLAFAEEPLVANVGSGLPATAR